MIRGGCFRELSLVEELEGGEGNHWEARERGMCEIEIRGWRLED